MPFDLQGMAELKMLLLECRWIERRSAGMEERILYSQQGERHLHGGQLQFRDEVVRQLVPALTGGLLRHSSLVPMKVCLPGGHPI